MIVDQYNRDDPQTLSSMTRNDMSWREHTEGPC